MNKKTINAPSVWKIVKWPLIALVLFSFGGFLVAPPVAKYFLTKNLSETLGRDVFIEDIDLNPYALSAKAYKFLIKDKDKASTLLSFDELSVNLQISSILKKGLVIKEITLDRPSLHIVHLEGARYNFSDLTDGSGEEAAPGAEPLRFSFNNIQILNGSIDFLDTPLKTKHEVRDITLAVPMISNMPSDVEIHTRPLFRAVVNGTSFALDGETKPFSDSLETHIDLDIKDIDMPHYLAYVPFPVNFKLLSGTISGQSRISYVQFKDSPAALTVTGDMSLENLKVTDLSDNPLIQLPLYGIRQAVIDLTQKTVTINEAYSKDGSLFIQRSKDGTVNIEPQLPRLAEKLEEAAEKKEEAPWTVAVKKMAYDDFTISFEDLVPADPVKLVAEEIKLKGENITTKKDSRGSLACSFKLNKTGSVSAESRLSINPVSADTKFSVKDIALVPLQPYITEQVNILITNGALSAEGDLFYQAPGEMGSKTDFKGTVSVAKFATVDKKTAGDFLKWKSLFFKGIDFKLEPLKVHINSVALTDFYSRLAINSDGSMNVQEIVKKEEGKPGEVPSDGLPEKDKRAAGGEKIITVNAVTLQGGTVQFSDQHIKPSYAANLLEIGGRISGLSSKTDSTADVDLKGKLENYAPLEIRGKINPLADKLFVDLSVDFTDMDLSSLTPYAGKYAGYSIQKGRLSLGLKYLIAGKKLDSENKVMLDQFTFGEQVESPDATKLPVRLAVSLLKDRTGEINLDLPVSGKIDDPEFRIGRVVLTMITNILVKVATSPFALLGKIVGGGEELSYVEFEYGSADMSMQSREKLDKLVTALSERPNLNVDVAGFSDIEQDRKALRQNAFTDKLKAQKMKDMIAAGQPGISLGEIEIGADEYEQYVGMAYNAETFPKPRDAEGLEKKLPPEEMEKLILTNIIITDDNLRVLASKRALAVKNYFLKSGGIDSKRIFLTESTSLLPEKKDTLKNSRVDFTLK